MEYISYETDPTAIEQNTSDVIILHDRFTRRRADRYVTNFAQCLEYAGFQVTIIASEVEEERKCLEDIKLSGNIRILKRAQWIPRHIFGLFRSFLSTYRALCLALSVLFYCPSQKPCVVITDTDLISVFILKMFTRHKVFYIEPFRALRNPETSNDFIHLLPNLFEARWIKMADEIIVESPAFVDIFKRSYSSAIKEPKVLIPLIDFGLWMEPGIDIDRIIPDLNSPRILFVALGRCRRSSNFKLALDSFECMLEETEDPTFKQRAHLVIGSDSRLEEEIKYYTLFVDRLKRRWFASKVTVLRRLPTIHTKTLMLEASVFLHTSTNDVCSDYLLEAMSLGKPIVALNRGIASKLLENRITGVLVEPQPHFVAAAMIKVATSLHIQTFLGEMAKDAFKHMYSSESFTKRLYNMVQKHIEPLEGVEKPSS